MAGYYCDGKTDNTGNFSITIPKQPAGRQLHVLVKGQDGYSKYTKLFVKTDQAPEAPKVNAISSQDTNLTGSTEPNSMIYVKVWPDIIATGKQIMQETFPSPCQSRNLERFCTCW
ncbi:hypothetical protein F6Y02_02300 [Bacillus megaterium]|nr:hypothetical protein [Priestia megaterium]